MEDFQELGIMFDDIGDTNNYCGVQIGDTIHCK